MAHTLDSPRGGGSDGYASFLRHERLTVAMVMSEKMHHTSRSHRKDRTREGGIETHHTAEIRRTSPSRRVRHAARMDEDDSVPQLGEGRPAPRRRGNWSGTRSAPQLGRELVEVPNGVSQSEFQQHSVEQER